MKLIAITYHDGGVGWVNAGAIVLLGKTPPDGVMRVGITTLELINGKILLVQESADDIRNAIDGVL